MVILVIIGKSLSYYENSKTRTDISNNVYLQSKNDDEDLMLDEISDPNNPMFTELQEELLDEYEK